MNKYKELCKELRELNCHGTCTSDDCIIVQATAALEALEVKPDAVVRCKDCKHCDISKFRELNGTMIDYYECQKMLERYNSDEYSSFNAEVEPDDFCSYGELKQSICLKCRHNCVCKEYLAEKEFKLTNEECLYDDDYFEE